MFLLFTVELGGCTTGNNANSLAFPLFLQESFCDERRGFHCNMAPSASYLCSFSFLVGLFSFTPVLCMKLLLLFFSFLGVPPGNKWEELIDAESGEGGGIQQKLRRSTGVSFSVPGGLHL